jgi:hypothetical protein
MAALSIDQIIAAFGLLSDPGEFVRDLREFLDHYEENARLPQVAEEEKDSGHAQDVSNDFLYAVYDQRDLILRPKRKWYLPNTVIGDTGGATRLTKKEGLCFHHTAVKGGFGAHKAIVDRYLRENVIDMARFRTTNRELSKEEWARAMALAHRFRGDPAGPYNNGVPYHALMAANSVLYLNLPFDWVTWHGNGSNNRFLGVAWDAKSTVDEIHAADLIADIVALVELARAEGHDIREFTCHCAYTNKPQDPGAKFIRLVMVPAAAQLGCLIDYDFKVKKGARSIGEVLAA